MDFLKKYSAMVNGYTRCCGHIKLTSEVTKWTQSLNTTFPPKRAGFFHIENSEFAQKLVFFT